MLPLLLPVLLFSQVVLLVVGADVGAVDDGAGVGFDVGTGYSANIRAVIASVLI
jgi:hypothetical protein